MAFADSGASWTLIRTLRADPPPKASRGARRKTFAAALEQSQELWEAGTAVAPTVQPIIFFYGLTQAARAIYVARVSTARWEGKPSHGLTLSKANGPTSKARFKDVHVRDHGQGFFQDVAALLGSPTLPAPVSLAELASSLPERDKFPLADEALGPLEVHNYDDLVLGRENSPEDLIGLWIAPLPDPLRPTPTPDQVAGWLASYPRLAPLGPPSFVSHVWQADLGSDDFDRYAVVAGWRVGEPLDWGGRYRYCARLFDLPEQGVRIPRSGLVLPAIDGNTTVMPPLLTWWAFLFGCSMLARYHPRLWMQLLDVDSNCDAVPAATALRIASAEVPKLLFNELLAAYP